MLLPARPPQCEISAHGLEVLVFPRALLDWRPPDSITAADAAFISKVNSKGIARVPFVDSLPVTAQVRLATIISPALTA